MTGPAPVERDTALGRTAVRPTDVRATSPCHCGTCHCGAAAVGPPPGPPLGAAGRPAVRCRPGARPDGAADPGLQRRRARRRPGPQPASRRRLDRRRDGAERGVRAGGRRRTDRRRRPLRLAVPRRTWPRRWPSASWHASGWVASEFFKLIVARQRPNPALLFDPLSPETGSNSFPSGHVSFAVALGFALYFLARGTRWAKVDGRAELPRWRWSWPGHGCISASTTPPTSLRHSWLRAQRW